LAGPKLSATEIRLLYEQHGAALLLYARSFVADAAAGEDLVHEVFLKLLRGETSVPDIPLAYLYRAVRNAALNTLRNRSGHPAWDDQISWFQHREGNREEELALQSALGELPEDQRATVIMRIWGGMTLEEIADATAVPLSTAASRYRYALEKLRERLKPWRRPDKEE
jgi:RNA polymerase sigma-70 factor, ECF subfamily